MKRLTLELTDLGDQRLAQLAAKLNRDKAGAIRHALSILETLLEIKDEEGFVHIKRGDSLSELMVQ